MERLFTGFPEATGIPYLTELTTAVEGTGQFVALLQGMAQMKIVSKVTGVSTDAGRCRCVHRAGRLHGGEAVE